MTSFKEFLEKNKILVIITIFLFLFLISKSILIDFGILHDENKICKEYGPEWRFYSFSEDLNSIFCITEKEFCETSTDGFTSCSEKRVFKELDWGIVNES